MEVLFFDTESTDLSASWGRILCASFVNLDGDLTSYRGDSKKYKSVGHPSDDAALCVAIREKLESAGMIVGWNSILHDIPLINARLAKVGEPPVRLGKEAGTLHLDLMYYAGGTSLKIGGRRLDTVAKYFKAEHQKTGLDGDVWQDAALGSKKDMDYIVDHCEADALVLLDLWPHLAPYVKKFSVNFSDVWEFVQLIPGKEGQRG